MKNHKEKKCLPIVYLFSYSPQTLFIDIYRPKDIYVVDFSNGVFLLESSYTDDCFFTRFVLPYEGLTFSNV